MFSSVASELIGLVIGLLRISCQKSNLKQVSNAIAKQWCNEECDRYTVYVCTKNLLTVL